MMDVCAGDLEKAFKVRNIDLHVDRSQNNIIRYFDLYKDFTNLHVTTSCFTIWKDHKNVNGYAKVIPALPVDGAHANIRVFFFDDNLDVDRGCAETSPGICNLRHLETGEFIDHSVGTNGFKRDYAAGHTVIHYSTEFNNVLVKANILDAMQDKAYFTGLIGRYAKPGEKLIVYMDVNSTIVCHDTMTGKDVSAIVLSTMFEVIDIKPREPFEFVWEAFPSVVVDSPITLKMLVKKATDRDGYNAFWTEANCHLLLRQLADRGDVRWSVHEAPLTEDNFRSAYQEYAQAITDDVDRDGIVSSWYSVFDYLKDRHATVLNSFGVDCRKVILATLPSERDVTHVVVNYELWDARDMKKYVSQFADMAEKNGDGRH